MEPLNSPTERSGFRLGIDGRVLDDRYHGIGRITYELLDRLTQSGPFDITLFVARGQRSGRFDIDRIVRRSGVRLAHFDHALTSASQFLRWPAALRRSRIDLVLFPYHLGASMFGGGERFAVVHDCVLEADRQFAPNARTRALYILLTRLVIRRTRVITATRAAASQLLGFYGIQVPDSQLLPWGVDASFAGAATGPSVVGGVDLPQHYYLHVGARRPHKNVPQLVRVLAGPDTRAGPGTRCLPPDSRVRRRQRTGPGHLVPERAGLALPLPGRRLRPAPARGDGRRSAGHRERRPGLP
jgi:hypothetical protein